MNLISSSVGGSIPPPATFISDVTQGVYVMKPKELTDEQLENIGHIISEMLHNAVELWEADMKTLLLNSSRYRSICTSARHIQTTYIKLRDMAYDRGWKDEKVKKHFTINTAYGFS